jgi:hypothetical protein
MAAASRCITRRRCTDYSPERNKTHWRDDDALTLMER